jgi:hypothetical protein
VNRYYWNLRFDPTADERREAEERQRQLAAGGRGGGPGGFGGRQALGSTAGAGTYRVLLTAGGRTLESTVTVREDPALAPPR